MPKPRRDTKGRPLRIAAPPVEETGREVEPAEREVLHPEPRCELRLGPRALTARDMKKFLGWEVIPKEDKTTVPLLVDVHGNRIRCIHNSKNRPFNEAWAYQIAQEILNRNARWNGEAIIIGRTGLVLSAQHRAAGLILAVQLWESDAQRDHWHEIWPTEPVWESNITYGVEETPEVIRTLDNVRPRSDSDIFYSQGAFDGVSASARERMCKALEYAVRLLWDHTRVKDNPYGQWHGYRTRSESNDFVRRHPRLADCIRHVFEENRQRAKKGAKKAKGTKGPIEQYISLGYAAGLLYLMGASRTDPDTYRQADPPGETVIDWHEWSRAKQLWVDLVKQTDEVKALRLAHRIDRDDLLFREGAGRGSLAERKAALSLAWDLYRRRERLTPSSVSPSYSEDRTDDGTVIPGELLSNWSFGGIDLLNEDEPEGGEEGGEGEGGEEEVRVTTDQEIANRKRLEREKREAIIKEAAERAKERRTARRKALSATIAEPGQGKPPPPRLKRQTRRQVEEEQTRRAAEADAAMADGRE